MSNILTPKTALKFIEHAIKIKEIPYISGPPGIGKSDIVAEIANKFNLKLLDIRLSQKLPEDLTGIPSLDSKNKKAKYNPFDTFPLEGDDIPENYDGWLVFLDELSSASEEVMAAIYSLLLGRTIGEHKLHDRAVIVAAGNRASDSAIARELPDTLISRLLPCELEVSVKDWLEWLKKYHNINDPKISIVYDFIKKYPESLHNTGDSSKRAELETFNNPRGWGKLIKILNLQKDNVSGKLNIHVKNLMYATGDFTAITSFIEFYEDTVKLPKSWEIAQSPGSIKIPSTSVNCALVVTDLIDYYIQAEDTTRENIHIFVNRMDSEYVAMFVNGIKSKLGTTKTDKKLIKELTDVFNIELNTANSVNDGYDDDITKLNW